MKFKEIFKSVGASGPISNFGLLDSNNCKIISRKMDKDSALLGLGKEDNIEIGHARVKVKTEFETKKNELLRWVFINEKILNLTLNQLQELETGLEFENCKGILTLKFN